MKTPEDITRFDTSGSLYKRDPRLQQSDHDTSQFSARACVAHLAAGMMFHNTKYKYQRGNHV